MKLTKRSSRGLGAFGLFLFLTIYAMAAIPALHLLAHDGARDARHECAVTLFAHGQVHSASTAVDWARPCPLLVSNQPIVHALFVSTDVQLLHSRGPPGLFFL
jgi:hypothetical protein